MNSFKKSLSDAAKQQNEQAKTRASETKKLAQDQEAFWQQHKAILYSIANEVGKTHARYHSKWKQFRLIVEGHTITIVEKKPLFVYANRYNLPQMVYRISIGYGQNNQLHFFLEDLRNTDYSSPVANATSIGEFQQQIIKRFQQ